MLIKRNIELYIEEGVVVSLPIPSRKGDLKNIRSHKRDQFLQHGTIEINGSIKAVLHAYVSGMVYDVQKKQWFTVEPPHAQRENPVESIKEGVVTRHTRDSRKPLKVGDTVYFILLPAGGMGIPTGEPYLVAAMVSKVKPLLKMRDKKPVYSKHSPCGTFVSPAPPRPN